LPPLPVGQHPFVSWHEAPPHGGEHHTREMAWQDVFEVMKLILESNDPGTFQMHTTPGFTLC
jgi:hypothetical protein